MLSRRVPPFRGPIGMAVVVALIAATASAAAQERLVSGATIEAQLKGGEVRAYEIDLNAGTYLDVLFDQQGIDIRPAIVGPDGATLFDLDTREWGMERASIVAPASGRYRLEARTIDKQAPPGRYVLHVDAIRPATSEDEARWGVLKLQLAAYAALQARTREAAERARPLYQQALEGWRSTGDRVGEADALTALGFIANWLDDFAAAADCARADVAIRRELHDEYGEARALRGLGIQQRIVGEAGDAMESFQRSLALHRAAGRRVNEADVLSELATVSRSAGDYGAAIENGNEAVALARQSANPQREADALLAVGLTHLELGEFEAAVDAFGRARTLAPDDERVRGISAAQTGLALVRLGRLDEGQRSLDEAFAIWSKRKWGGYLATTWRSYGELYLTRGDLDRARDAFDRAAAVSAEIGFVAGEASAQRESGETLLQLGRLDEAERAFAIAGSRLGRPPDPLDESALLASRARLALARHNLAEAHAQAEEAVGLLESTRGRAENARIRTGLLASSHGTYEALIDVLMAEHAAAPAAGFDRRALEASERARARSLLEHVSFDRLAPRDAAPAPVAALERVQRRIAAKAQALDDARRARAPALERSISVQIDELAAEYAAIEARLRREAPETMATAAPEPLSADAIQHGLLDPGTVLVEYMVGRLGSYAWTVSREGIRSYRLAGRAAVAEAARVLRAAHATPPRGTAAAGGAARPPSRVQDRASRMLLAPFEAIPAGKRVMVVAPGELQQLPWAALRVGPARTRLVARHEIVLAPSASIVAALRDVRAHRAPAARLMAVFADPVFDRDDPRVAASSSAGTIHPPAVRSQGGGAQSRGTAQDAWRAGLARLPFTRMEAETLASLAPPGSVRKATGFEASLAAVTDPAMVDYRIVHFATHGILDTRTPELSGLVLSLVDRRGRPQDGFLRLLELDRLHLKADLAVLSGCETALGRTVDGEGVIGLTRGFLAAGAQRVLASVWKVDDLATAEIMKRFYTALLQRRMPATAALRSAQLEMARSARWSDPYYWAGWVMNGDWR